MRLILDNVTKSFRGRSVVSGFDAAFEANHITALVGPSGSGKSTLLALIAGIEKLDSGRIYFQLTSGERTPSPSDFVWVAQSNSALPHRSVRDNVMIGALSGGSTIENAKLATTAALDSVGLSEHSSVRLRELSGGERQRVCFARAIASNRPFILADEPSSSLDAANTTQLASILGGLRHRVTVIVATHDPVMIAATHAILNVRGEPS